MMPVSMLSRYLVSAREGHLGQVFHVFAYLKTHETSTMVFDDTEPDFDDRRFKDCDWSEYYPDAVEAIPRDMHPQNMNTSLPCLVVLAYLLELPPLRLDNTQTNHIP